MCVFVNQRVKQNWACRPTANLKDILMQHIYSIAINEVSNQKISSGVIMRKNIATLVSNNKKVSLVASEKKF